MIIRWIMFGFCVVVVAGMWAWGFYLLFTDPWMGERMLPVCVLVSLPSAGMGIFWWARATHKI